MLDLTIVAKFLVRAIISSSLFSSSFAHDATSTKNHIMYLAKTRCKQLMELTLIKFHFHFITLVVILLPIKVNIN